MSRAAPTEQDMLNIVDAVLADARARGVRATVTTLATYAGVTRPTLYRNYPAVVDKFVAQAAENRSRSTQRQAVGDQFRTRIVELRNENEQLRLHLDLYEEHIRRLTTENALLRDELNRAKDVIVLPGHQRNPGGAQERGSTP